MGGACWAFIGFSSLLSSAPLLTACSKRHFAGDANLLESDKLMHFRPLSIRSWSGRQSTAPRRTCIVNVAVRESSAPGVDETDIKAETKSPELSSLRLAESIESAVELDSQKRRLEKERRRNAERTTYLFAAIASSVGVTFLAAGAVYYRFTWQTAGAGVPLSEMFGTFALAVGASVGMEFWARWAHRALWHDSLWSMHESHHRPRDGPFELNDVFAIINAIPAISLMAFGFFNKGLVPGLCFGAGLGITLFGIAYMFVHDGLVHRRFPVGPVANVPYLQKVAAAHQLHHADKFKGVPFGLFLGPKELEEEVGGAEELEKMIQIRKKLLAH